MDIRELADDIRYKSSLFQKVIDACKELLHTKMASETKKYIQGRLSNYSIDKYDIGYFPPNHELSYLLDKVDRKDLEYLRLIYPKTLRGRGFSYQIDNSLLNHHNLIIPFRDEYGNIIALAGRTLLSEEQQRELSISKYKNTFYTKGVHLFGLYHAKNTIDLKDSIIIVEGQIDCIMCQAQGIFNVVALTGSSLSDYQVYLIKKMTQNVYLLLDNDLAGKNASEKIINNYSQELNIKKLELPNKFKDVDEYLKLSASYDLFDQCRTVPSTKEINAEN